MYLGFADQWTSPNNNYGPETVEVVKNFQSYYGLAVNGIVDEVTYAKIMEAAEAPFSEGANSPLVTEFKKDLMVAGFATSWTNPNSNYGPETIDYVKEFQSYYGLEATGNGDEATLNKLEEVLNSPYQLGESSSAIREVKTQLMNLGFADQWTNPNDNYGPEMVEVVENFQSHYGLVVNGIVDAVTIEKINALLESPYQLGESHPEIREMKSDLMTLGFGTHWNSPNSNYGPETVEVVKNFQSYYGLPVNGIVDSVTAEKINALLDSPYRLGESSAEIREMKSDLMALGFGTHWNSPNNNYGPETVEVVKNFQSYYGLAVNGIMDSVTAEKMTSVLNSHYQLGNSSAEIREIKTDLMLLGFANHWYSPNDHYGPEAVEVVKNFQTTYGLPVSGIVDEVTYSEIKSLLNHRVYSEYNITLDEAMNMQMRVKPQTDRNYAYVSAEYIDNNGKVTASALNIRSGLGTSNAVVGTLSQGDTVNIISEVNGWYQIEYSGAGWVDAARADVKYYLNPNNFMNLERQSFQFLNLERPSGATPSELNSFLEGKGILEGMGQAFIDAGRIHGVNEIYLLSHALLETGHGTSTLATGVKVNGVTVYNMFGIGAVDSNPLGGGSQRAYQEGWTTPEKSIIGGAQFIGNNYVKAGQNTLYKMRWNPAAMAINGYATHQYATDIGWASKQVNTMHNLYNEIGLKNIFLDIPVYK